MLAGIVGDVVGSIYEGKQWLSPRGNLMGRRLEGEEDQGDPQVVDILKKAHWVRKEPCWTDDTLCTLALYDAWEKNRSPVECLLHYAQKYRTHTVGFGGGFLKWLDDPKPYGSWANGAIMRIGFIPWLELDLESQWKIGHSFTEISHNHPDSFKAVKDLIEVSRGLKQSHGKEVLRMYLNQEGYTKSVRDLHEERKFELNALETLKQAMVVVHESDSFSDVLRKALHVGGDSDTLACVAANMGAFLFQVNEELLRESLKTLEPFEDLMAIVHRFQDSIKS